MNEKRREDARTRAGRQCVLQKLREICMRFRIGFGRSALECGESSHRVPAAYRKWRELEVLGPARIYKCSEPVVGGRRRN